MFKMIIWKMLSAVVMFWLDHYDDNLPADGELWYIYNRSLGVRPDSVIPKGKRVSVEICLVDDPGQPLDFNHRKPNANLEIEDAA